MKFASAHAMRAVLHALLLLLTAACGQVSVNENSAESSNEGVDNPNPQQRDSVTLNWVPPTEYVDGSPLEDLTAYRIYSGPSQDVLAHRETLDNPGLSSHVVEALESDERYFAITALNSTGAESVLSEVVQAPDG